MEYLKKEELYKNRSYAKCISCGYHALTGNYKSILSYTWKSALAFFIVNMMALILTDGFAIPTDTLGGVIWCVMSVATILSMFYMDAHIVNTFANQGKLVVFRRLLTMFFWSILVLFLSLVFIYATTLFSFQAEYGKAIIIGVSSFIVLLMIILGIPFCYLSVKYVVDDEKRFFNVVRKNFYKGFSHWGLIFVTFILSSLLFMILSVVIALPTYMLVTAKIMSETGIFMGDESGLPAYFPYIYGITIAAISVLLMYVKTFIFSTLYYTYGSIEQRNNERIGFMENSKKF